MLDLTRYIPVAIVIIVYTVRMMELWKKRDLVPGEIKESRTLNLFKLVGLFVVFFGIVEYFYAPKLISWMTIVGGVLVSVLSFYIRWQAIKALGKFWSLHVEIRSNHQFVRTGPFRFVRHPAYTSMIMEIIAVGLILQAPISAAVALLLIVPVLYKRITIEERELTSKFGDAYSEYRRVTPALLPIKF